MKVLSFGGGVQTVTLAVMACLGDYDMPDVAIFADTGWETKATYKYLSWFEGWMKERGLGLIKVQKGNIRKNALAKNKRFASMPVFTESEKANGGMLFRQCTNEYKVQPIARQIRTLLGLQKGKKYKGDRVELWLGISMDEVHRMKDNRILWLKNHYPLIDKRMTRGDCMEYLKSHGIPVPPKSACIGCPYHSNMFWRYLKNNSYAEFEDACEFDEALRNHMVSIKNKVYLHRTLKPLREAYLEEDQMELFGEECEGHCGL